MSRTLDTLSAYPAAAIAAAEAPLTRGTEAYMHAAAQALAQAAAEELRALGGSVVGAPVLVLAGGGHNGGDALLAGALLARQGCDVTARLATEQPHAAALAEARRRTGRLRAPGSGGRSSRRRDRLRPVRMGATGEVPDPSSRSARRRGRWDRRRMGPASRSYPRTPVRRAWTVPRTRPRSGEGPTAVIGSEDVDFDVAAAVALVPRCRSAAEQVRTLHSSRTGRASSIPGGRCR